jgi:DMSO/TMAO reductase YedYZ molybdopterin-dependent catalytic subunit
MPTSDPKAAQSRRVFFRRAGLLAAGIAGLPAKQIFADEAVTMPFLNGERTLVTYPQKRPLIRVTTRPPQLETPFSVFNEGVLTPNDAFFVRYHLSNIPTEIDMDKFSLSIGGSVNAPITFSFAQLKKFEPVEIAAVLQCSGNSRGFMNPRVGGGQLGNGAMGNAKWKGVRLRDLFAKSGLKATAKQVTFNGLDKPPTEKTPDFVKALDLDHANDGEIMLAYEMNGQPLPVLNGFPLRLIVPGYYGTYWVKHVNEITVIDEPLNNFWMNPAYRIPDNDCACVPPGGKPDKTVPIARYNVRSFITSVSSGAQLKVGQDTLVKGIAFDGGKGIKSVAFWNGSEWRDAKLGKDYGKYSFREWVALFKAPKSGNYELKSRATSVSGEVQPDEPRWNPSGYMRNVIESIMIKAV